MFTSDGPSKKILIVDDDSNQVVILSQILKEIGDVYFELDGLAALITAKKSKPDIILLDIDLPYLNGLEVIDKLKENKSTRNIPIIFITSHNTIEGQLDCLKKGAVDYIAKPLHPRIVAARVKLHLALQAKGRQIAELFQHSKIALDAIGDAVITTDKNCRITFMNPTAELIIGILFNQARGKLIEEIMPLRVGFDKTPHINPLRISIQDNRIVGLAINCQIQKQNGQWIAIHNSSAPLVSDTNEVVGGVIVFNEPNSSDMKMTHTIQYDQLTNLPNRFLFLERLNAHIDDSYKNKSKLGLILIDINKFKFINEEYGFEFGDQLLKDIAVRIKIKLSNNEILSRHNADEFILLVPKIEDPKTLADLAESIKGTILGITEDYPSIDSLSVSMGLSIYPDDANNSESLLLHAGSALQRAKKQISDDNYCFYSADMELQDITRRKIYSRIKSAIITDDIVSLYQPIIDVNTGKTVAVEALMRIKNEDGGLIPPLDFIPLAEETKLIIPLGEIMILLCFKQLRSWVDRGMNIRMCINISPVQFTSPKFFLFLMKSIKKYKIDPRMIELEVTESLMLKDLSKVIIEMNKLKEIGITISIDDFGTGFSCLSYLKKLPINVVKIDKSFVSDISEFISDEVLVKTIITLAKSMKFQTIAEGVESTNQANRLRELGVSYLQGYIFSRPVVADEIKKEYVI